MSQFLVINYLSSSIKKISYLLTPQNMPYGWVMLTPEQEKIEKAFKVNAEKAFKKIVAEFTGKYVQAPNPEFGYCSDYSYK
jgi:hypothetical protein